MKSFDELWVEIGQKIESGQADSGTVSLINSGIHSIGKKIMEEAGEVWIAAEYQSNEQLALEISQLLYYLQVLAKARGISLEEIYKEL
ncbi:MAG: phosphoribosyl-ATP pyrophosphatase [Actinomycetota bacterium]|jgi:phosphoribosyl-ATP pyrophosphohydrolase|nr:phosphoribosyl-ATP diphosphatase [Actinomycetota bacterium]